MEHTMESGRPVPTPFVDPVPPVRVVFVAPIPGETSPRVGSGPAYSFWADCECPGDCLRDHANE